GSVGAAGKPVLRQPHGVVRKWRVLSARLLARGRGAARGTPAGTVSPTMTKGNPHAAIGESPSFATAQWSIDAGGSAVSARLDALEHAPGRLVFVCAHGAGGHFRDRGMDRLVATLVPLGIDVVRFNFPYRERKSGRPDPMP